MPDVSTLAVHLDRMDMTITVRGGEAHWSSSSLTSASDARQEILDVIREHEAEVERWRDFLRRFDTALLPDLRCRLKNREGERCGRHIHRDARHSTLIASADLGRKGWPRED